MTLFRNTVDQKAGMTELEGLRRIIDNVLNEMKDKCKFRDLEQQQ
jgi:hypothetical protein